MRKSIAFTGGGTAGHVFPGLAVAEFFRTSGEVDLFWLGASKGMEKNLVQKWGMEFHGLPAGKLRRYFSFQNFWDLFKIFAGFLKALWILSRKKPDLLFSKGGFVSVPPVWAASVLGIPVFSHESDIDPGLATKLNMGRSKGLFCAYEETVKHFPPALRSRVKVSGNPVRRAVLEGNAVEGRKAWNVGSDQLLVLVMGGSQGARQLNDLVQPCLTRWGRRVVWVHQTGSDWEAPAETDLYHPRAFLSSELPDLLAAADIMVTRAGAGALWEGAALGKPLLLVPLYAGSRGDQVRNAELFVSRGAAALWKEDSGVEGFARDLDRLIQSPEVRNNLSRNIRGFNAAGAAEFLALALQAHLQSSRPQE